MTHDDSSDSAMDGGAAAKSECVRRSVLRGGVVLGAVAVGGGLSRIGSGSSGGASLASAQSSTPAAATGVAAAPAAGGTAAAPAAAGGAAAPAKRGATAAAKKGHVVGLASKIPVGGGAIFEKAQVVVTQPTAGVYKAFSAMCTHQQCILADVSGGTINCACHGAKYSITDGSVVAPPAIDPLPVKTVTVAGGNVSVA